MIGQIRLYKASIFSEKKKLSVIWEEEDDGDDDRLLSEGWIEQKSSWVEEGVMPPVLNFFLIRIVERGVLVCIDVHLRLVCLNRANGVVKTLLKGSRMDYDMVCCVKC